MAAVEGKLTRLLLFGPAGGFVGLAPDGDPVLQELQRSPLLPVRRAHLQAQTAHLLDLSWGANGHSCQQLPSPCWSPATSASRPRHPAPLQFNQAKAEKQLGKRRRSCRDFLRYKYNVQRSGDGVTTSHSD